MHVSSCLWPWWRGSPEARLLYLGAKHTHLALESERLGDPEEGRTTRAQWLLLADGCPGATQRPLLPWHPPPLAQILPAAYLHKKLTGKGVLGNLALSAQVHTLQSHHAI